jgi:hypothetical protein
MHSIHSLHHPVSSFSILGMVIGVVGIPIAILGTLFLVARALVGG